jgi:TRAP-type mannitol/chloroaromatic compound transport system permease small subunit
VTIIRLIDGLNEVVGRAIVLLALVFGGIIIFDVVMRYGFRAPTRWAFDVTTLIYGFYFIMLGGYALRHRAHVSVDLLVDVLPRTARRVVEAAGYLIFFFPFATVFAWRAYLFAERSFLQRETTWGAVQLPVYPVKMAMAVAAVLLLIQGISQFLKILLDKQEHENVR